MSTLDRPLRLPAPAVPPTRPPLPLLTAVVPVVGAVVLWLVTGSAFALWFAALGPLLAVAALVDGRRAARRSRRRADAEARRALDAVADEIARRHADERRARRGRHPDVAGYLADEHEVWRAVPGRGDAVVVGSGDAPSDVRVEGEADGSALGEAARDLREGAALVPDAPVLVPLGAGIAVTGPPVPAAAVARALALQLCLAHPPGRLRLAEGGAPVAGLPHADAVEGLVLHCGEGGRPLPADADIVIVRVDEGTPPPPRCAAVITVEGDLTGRLDHAGASCALRLEAISVRQAEGIAALLHARAAASLGISGARPRTLRELLALAPSGGSAPHRGLASHRGLAVALGDAAGEPFVLDLVADGPHAVVIGVTGAGKSELLTTWIAAMSHVYGPDRVAFLLVDFKGGRAFDALAALPHVTGVLTDLDDAAALRAVESLRSEMRRREAALAVLGARDVDEAEGALPRLVVVVDEYAALTAAHPALHDLFGDIAARGRALGMHLVLASQRAAGAFRDAVLANAPLRIALRVTDAADSRAVLGSDAAVRLSGRAEALGTALVRRAADAAPRTVRVPRCDADVVREAETRHPAPPATPPWLPPLPAQLPLTRVSRPGAVVLGLVDEPEHQRQRAAELGAAGLVVVGGPGSGKTGVLHAIGAQSETVLRVPAGAEEAWDAIASLDGVPSGGIVLFDDADAVLARLGGEHLAAAVERLAAFAREARGRDVRLVLTCARIGGPLARVVELLPDRLLLALPTRADHVAAGGDGIHHSAELPLGRGRWRGRLVQVAAVEPPADAPVPAPALWRPGHRPVALVAPAGPRTAGVLVAWGASGVRVGEHGAALVDGAVVHGTPEEWLAQWRLLAQARAEADLVVDAAYAAEYRAITGARELPPYATPGARRAWLHRAGSGRARRIVLPG